MEASFAQSEREERWRKVHGRIIRSYTVHKILIFFIDIGDESIANVHAMRISSEIMLKMRMLRSTIL